MHVGLILLLIDLAMTPDKCFTKSRLKKCILASMSPKSTSCVKMDISLPLNYSLLQREGEVLLKNSYTPL